MRFILLVTLSLISLHSFALNYSGTVLRNNLSLRLLDSNSNKSYSLSAATPLMASYLNKLDDGDFISIDADKNGQQTQLTVNSVNYVGLQVLLGTWSGDDNYYYNFKSFNEFSLSKKINADTAIKSEYTYLINPANTAWTILISGPYNSYLGGLNIYNSHEAEIQLYDSETGEILRTVQLRK
jgi:hypothetical protein